MWSLIFFPVNCMFSTLSLLSFTEKKCTKTAIQLRINHYGNWNVVTEKGEDVFSPQLPASCHIQPLRHESRPKYRLWPALRNYICIFINWYKNHTIKEDLIPWTGWQTLGTLASVWQGNNGMLCSKTWINGKPFFMLLQFGVNERTKHAVSLGKNVPFVYPMQV